MGWGEAGNPKKSVGIHAAQGPELANEKKLREEKRLQPPAPPDAPQTRTQQTLRKLSGGNVGSLLPYPPG